jgi:putative DNA primase/helicase
MLSLQAIAHALNGEIIGGQVLAPGPSHSSRDRSLSVMASAAAPDGFIVHSFAGDDAIECRDHVRRRLGLPEFSPGKPRGSQSEPARYKDRSGLKRVASGLPKDDSYNHKLAMAIWAEAHDPRGTPVEAYLQSRCLELPCEAANEAIRFHPACFFGKERYPAMVCLVRNIATNEPQGVHRTALATNGTAVKRGGKTLRMTLGQMAGGAIKLDPDEHVTRYLCIGEGVETCLSGRQLELHPVWSVVNTSGVADFQILPAIDGIAIIRENDPNGASARVVKKCADRWFEAGREVFIITSELGSDLNDELWGAVQ